MNNYQTEDHITGSEYELIEIECFLKLTVDKSLGKIAKLNNYYSQLIICLIFWSKKPANFLILNGELSITTFLLLFFKTFPSLKYSFSISALHYQFYLSSLLLESFHLIFSNFFSSLSELLVQKNGIFSNLYTPYSKMAAIIVFFCFPSNQPLLPRF